MRKDRRKFTVEIIDGERTLCYKDIKCPFDCGRDDYFEIFRYGDDFFVLTTHRLLGYAGFSLISIDGELIQDLFFQNVDEVFEGVKGTSKSFFEFTPNYQADFLAMWIQ